MAHTPDAHLRSLVEVARAIAARCEALETRIDALAPRLPVVGDGTQAGASRIHAILTDLQSQTLSQLQGITLDDANGSLSSIAGHIDEVVEKMDQMPEDLETAVETKLAEAQEDFAERTAAAIEKVEAAYAETKQRITDALDQTFEHLKDELGEAHNKLADSLEKVKGVVSEADQDVRRIVSALERTRDTVLSACRVAGIGAQAAAPALESATSAFSAVG